MEGHFTGILCRDPKIGILGRPSRWSPCLEGPGLARLGKDLGAGTQWWSLLQWEMGSEHLFPGLK